MGGGGEGAGGGGGSERKREGKGGQKIEKGERIRQTDRHRN